MPQASVAQGSTCGLAIGSLGCGLLGFVTLITSIPAVILGHISLSKIRGSGGALKGKGMAITGLITGYLCIAIIPIAALAGLAAPLILRQRAAADRVEMSSNMKQVGLALLEFDQEFGSFPNDDTAEEVVASTGSSVPVTDLQGRNLLGQLEVFGMSEPLDDLLKVPKSADGEWLYLPNDNSAGGASRPVLISPALRGKRIVLRFDNAVAELTEAEVEGLIRTHPEVIVIPYKAGR